MYHMISSDGQHHTPLHEAHTFEQANSHASFIASMDENYQNGYKVVQRVPIVKAKPKKVRRAKKPFGYVKKK